MVTRRQFHAAAAAAAAAALTLRVAAAGRGSHRTSALRQAAAWLWSQQADDGGWHSEKYGLMRSGQSLTPFVLHALMQVPDELPHSDGGIRRALDFIAARISADGSLGHADPDVPEYPVYSTAYALSCLDAAARRLPALTENFANRRERMAAFLAAAQLTEQNGFTPSHPAYGGWGFDKPPASGESGHMDLAHTRRALEALRLELPLASNSEVPDYAARAQLFLRVVQRRPDAIAQPHVGLTTLPRDEHAAPLPFDGGFYFSPVVTAANKGRTSDDPAPHWQSYATATCDGILALLAAGVPRSDDRVAAAVAWLRSHPDVDYPQGVPAEYPEPWGEAIRFYHYAVRAEVYSALNFPPNDRHRLAAALARRQCANGSFVNDASPLMKEDDPVLCTALATLALVSVSNRSAT